MKVAPVHTPQKAGSGETQIESAYAWTRLWTSLFLGTIGSVGMWSVVVVLPTVQADFGVARADASLPYTLAMLGFGAGGIFLGRLADRFGIAVPVIVGAVGLGVGYVAAGLSPNLWSFAVAHAVIGFGASATFAPLMADISYWFTRRRGIAIAIASWQLSRWHSLAATSAIFHRHERLAPDPYRRRVVLHCRHAATLTRPAPPLAATGSSAGIRRRLEGRAARHIPERTAGSSLRRGRRLLRRNVDAAGSHRRLL